MKLWTASPIWRGERCFIVAGGPSLRGFDFDLLRGHRVIAVNSSIWSVPFADFCFYGDSRWGFEHHKRLEGIKATVITTASGHSASNVEHMAKIKPPPGLAEKRDTLVMDRTSLHAAINLAVHLGAAEIVLMGADMKAAENGITHHHEPHPWPSVQGCWDHQMKQLALLPPALKAIGVKVINASLGSRIPWWPKQPIEALL